MTQYKTLLYDKLWRKNPAFAQLLGLCPLLAITTKFVYGLSLGIATTTVFMVSSLTISLIRPVIPPQIRVLAFLLIMASYVTIIELLTKAFFYELYLALGIFIPLIMTNCAFLTQINTSEQNYLQIAINNLLTGLGFLLVLVILGGLRELLGYGMLFGQMDWLFGQSASTMTIILLENQRGLLLAILPPGALLCLGLLLACKNLLDKRQSPQQPIHFTLNYRPFQE